MRPMTTHLASLQDILNWILSQVEIDDQVSISDLEHVGVTQLVSLQLGMAGS